MPFGKGFLLYRVVSDGAGVSVSQRVEFSADVLPRPTQTRLALTDAASVRTKTAADAVAIDVIKHTFFHVFVHFKMKPEWF
jgi:hypothetical protein